MKKIAYSVRSSREAQWSNAWTISWRRSSLWIRGLSLENEGELSLLNLFGGFDFIHADNNPRGSSVIEKIDMWRIKESLRREWWKEMIEGWLTLCIDGEESLQDIAGSLDIAPWTYDSSLSSRTSFLTLALLMPRQIESPLVNGIRHTSATVAEHLLLSIFLRIRLGLASWRGLPHACKMKSDRMEDMARPSKCFDTILIQRHLKS